MASKIVKETKTYLIVRKYLHSSNDEYDTWELDETGKERFPQEFHENWHSALYEVEFYLKVDKKTGNYTILSVIEGDEVLLREGHEDENPYEWRKK